MTGAAPRDHRASSEFYLTSAMELPEGSPETPVYTMAAAVYAIWAVHDLLVALTESGGFPR